MLVITVELEGDNCWPDLAEKLDTPDLIRGTGIAIAVLSRGMESGRPSLTFRIDLPDGRVVLVETSLRLFMTAVKAIRARYGDGEGVVH